MAIANPPERHPGSPDTPGPDRTTAAPALIPQGTPAELELLREVLAEEDCDALALSHALLYQLYAADPEPFTLIMMNLARELSRRLRLTEELLFRHALPAPLVWHHPPTPVAETPFV